MPARPRVGFDVGDSSSEEEGENPNEPPDDGIPPQGSTAPRCGAGGARGRRRGPRGDSHTVAAKGTKRKTRDKTGTWGAVENSISIKTLSSILSVDGGNKYPLPRSGR